MLDRVPYWRHSAHDLSDDVTGYILAIEAEAVQREREALVERVAEALHKAAYPDRPCPDIGWHIDEARRLLGLEGGEATST